MGKCLVVAALLAAPLAIFAQGTVVFYNRVTSGSGDQSPIIAPIFGIDPACPSCQKNGNPTADWNGADGPTPVPLGTQVYGGPPLRGTGYTATLWAANVNLPDSALQLIATTTFSTRTEASFAGFIQAPLVNPMVPGVVGASSDRAKFEIRVWDNLGGTITSWDQLYNPGPFVIAPRGTSGIFTVDAPLGVGPTLPPTLQNFRSFSFLLLSVPEPSALVLGVLGALGGCLAAIYRATNGGDRASRKQEG